MPGNHWKNKEGHEKDPQKFLGRLAAPQECKIIDFHFRGGGGRGFAEHLILPLVTGHYIGTYTPNRVNLVQRLAAKARCFRPVQWAGTLPSTVTLS